MKEVEINGRKISFVKHYHSSLEKITGTKTDLLRILKWEMSTSFSPRVITLLGNTLHKFSTLSPAFFNVAMLKPHKIIYFQPITR